MATHVNKACVSAAMFAWLSLLLSVPTGCGGWDFEPLSPRQEVALDALLQSEYRAENTFLRIIADHGAVEPFQSLVYSNLQLSSALEELYYRRDLSVPLSNWHLTNVPRFETLMDACEGSNLAEIEVIAVYYASLLPDLPADVYVAYKDNIEASLDRHLTAFSQCAQQKHSSR